MSLVNDLLIEVDRQRDEMRGEKLSSLGRMSPRLRRKKRRVEWAPFFLIAGAMALFTAAAMIWGTRVEGLSSNTPNFIELAAVSARRPYSIATAGTTGPQKSESSSATVRLNEMDPSIRIARESAPRRVHERQTAIESITISHDVRTTRIRMTADESAAYRIDASSDPLEIEIILESAAMGAPIADLDMMGTPIRSIQAHNDNDNGNLRLELALDRKVRIQSQWMWQDLGAVLVIDLHDSGSAEPALTNPPSHSSRTDRMDALTMPTSSGPLSRAEINNADDQTISTSLQNANSNKRLHITRSEEDRRRHDRETLRIRARESLEAARFARANGKTTDADDLYQSAIRALPGYRDAILEWASLLAETDRTGQAVSLIRDARRKAPTDIGLTMLHATLIADSGDLDTAVEILDLAGHSLTQAPDVHALAAALLQQDGEHELAIERYETVLRRYPSKSRWWMGLGISLEATDQNAEALDVYRIAMQLGELPGKTRRWVSNRVTALSDEG